MEHVACLDSVWVRARLSTCVRGQWSRAAIIPSPCMYRLRRWPLWGLGIVPEKPAKSDRTLRRISWVAGSKKSVQEATATWRCACICFPCMIIARSKKTACAPHIDPQVRHANSFALVPMLIFGGTSPAIISTRSARARTSFATFCAR